MMTPRPAPPNLDEPCRITCPDCGRTSYHPMDVLQAYCGNCHKFHTEMVLDDETIQAAVARLHTELDK